MKREIAEDWMEMLLSNPGVQVIGGTFRNGGCCAVGVLQCMISEEKQRSNSSFSEEEAESAEIQDRLLAEVYWRNDGIGGKEKHTFEELVTYIDLNSDQL